MATSVKRRPLRIFKDAQGFYIKFQGQKIRVESDVSEKKLNAILMKHIKSKGASKTKRKRRHYQNRSINQINKKVDLSKIPKLFNSAYGSNDPISKPEESVKVPGPIQQQKFEAEVKNILEQVEHRRSVPIAPPLLLPPPPPPQRPRNAIVPSRPRTITKILPPPRLRAPSGSVLLVNQAGDQVIVDAHEASRLVSDQEKLKSLSKQQHELEQENLKQQKEIRKQQLENERANFISTSYLPKKDIATAANIDHTKASSARSGRSQKSIGDITDELLEKGTDTRKVFKSFLLSSDWDGTVKSVKNVLIPNLKRGPIPKSESTKELAIQNRNNNNNVERHLTILDEPDDEDANVVEKPLFKPDDIREISEAQDQTNYNFTPFTEEEFHGEGGGAGGLYDYEIEEIMKPYRPFGFLGVISSDEIPTLINKVKKFNEMKLYQKGDRFSFIMNLDPHTKPGSHWVACFIDPDFDRAIEYYDSYARDPPENFWRDMKKLIDFIDPPTLLKVKINRIVDQMNTTNTCGFFAIKFLHDRYAGIPFKGASGYDKKIDEWKNREEGEKLIQKFIKLYKFNKYL